MSDQMFEIYRKASESWFKLQQELFDGLYKSTMLLFQQTSPAPQISPAPEAKPPDDHSRILGANGSQASKATPKPGPAKPRHSRKATGARPGARKR